MRLVRLLSTGDLAGHSTPLQDAAQGRRQIMDAKARSHGSVKQRLDHELKEFVAISLYFYICFAAIVFYKAAVLQAEGIGYAPFGLAVVKALILGKFVLLGQAAHVGERFAQKPLIYPILYQSAIFLAMLVALTVVEEATVGVIHGHTIAQSVADIAGGTWTQIAATCFLLWLILLPYFGFRQIGKALGEGQLRRMLFVGP
jgi:hypothetical protein